MGVTIGTQHSDWFASPWPYLFVLLAWLPWVVHALRMYWLARGTTRELTVINHTTNPLRQVLMNFTGDELANQPVPNRPRTDDRYELLAKFQGVLKTFGYDGIVVLVDRVDEPHLINGSPELMKALLWSMLDNKFLDPGVGFKLLLDQVVVLRESRRSRFLPKGTARQAEHDPVAGVDRRSTVRRGEFPTEGSGHEWSRSQGTGSVRRGHYRPSADRRLPPPAQSSAPVQIPVPHDGVALQLAHRGAAGLANQWRDL